MSRAVIRILFYLSLIAPSLVAQVDNFTTSLELRRTYQYQQIGPSDFKDQNARLVIGVLLGRDVDPSFEVTLTRKDQTLALKPETLPGFGPTEGYYAYVLESAVFEKNDDLPPQWRIHAQLSPKKRSPIAEI